MWADRERTSLSETARSCCDDNSEDNYNNDDHVTQTQAICTISAPMCNVSDLLATRNQIIHQDHYWAVSSSSPIFCIIYKKFHPSSPASHSPAGVRAAPGPSTGHSLPCSRLPPSDLSLYVNVKLSSQHFYANIPDIKMLLVNITISLVIYFRSGQLRAILGDVWMNILQDKRHQALCFCPAILNKFWMLSGNLLTSTAQLDVLNEKIFQINQKIFYHAFSISHV